MAHLFNTVTLLFNRANISTLLVSSRLGREIILYLIVLKFVCKKVLMFWGSAEQPPTELQIYPKKGIWNVEGFA